MAEVEIVIKGSDRGARSAIDGVRGAMDDMRGSAFSVADAMEVALGGALVRVGEFGLSALGGAFRATIGEGLGFNNSMEQVTAQLNAFTKDGEASAEILEMIRERAAKTPFAFEEMARATAGLIPSANAAGMALEDIVAEAEILAASNPAEGLEGAAFALREAVSGDFTSIIERFNLPRQYINQLKEEGVPNIEIVQRAMREMGYDVDLVSNLSETASGRWSTFKDTLSGLAGTAMAPIFDRLSAGLGEITEYLAREDVAQRIEEIAAAVGERLGQAFDWLANTAVPMAITVFNVLKDDVLPVVMTGFGFLRDTIQTIAEAFAGNWIDNDAVQPLHRLAGILATALGGGDIRTAISDLWDLIRDVFGNLATWLQEQLPGWILALSVWGMKAWEWLQDAIPPLLEKAGEMAGQLVAFLADNLPSWIAKLLEWGTEAVAWIGRAIPPLIVKAGEFLATLINWARDTVLPALIEKAGEWSEALFMWVATKLIPEIKPKLMEFLATVKRVMTDDILPALRDAAGNIGQAILNGMMNAVDGIVGRIKGVMNQVIETFNNAIRAFNEVSPIDMPLIPGLATGTLYSGEGWHVVGERGAELVRLPRGSSVAPSGQTSAGGAAMRGGSVTININGGDVGTVRRVVADELLRAGLRADDRLMLGV